MTIFDAEATTALAALEEALLVPSARFANDLWLLLDNQEVARLLLTNPACSSQEIFIQFSKQASTWPQLARLPHTFAGKIRIHWVPSHSSIQGNTEADQAAREASDIPPHQIFPFSFNYTKRWVKEKTDRAIKEYWTQHAPQSYISLGIDSFLLPPQNSPSHAL